MQLKVVHNLHVFKHVLFVGFHVSWFLRRNAVSCHVQTKWVEAGRERAKGKSQNMSPITGPRWVFFFFFQLQVTAFASSDNATIAVMDENRKDLLWKGVLRCLAHVKPPPPQVHKSLPMFFSWIIFHSVPSTWAWPFSSTSCRRTFSWWAGGDLQLFAAPSTSPYGHPSVRCFLPLPLRTFAWDHHTTLVVPPPMAQLANASVSLAAGWAPAKKKKTTTTQCRWIATEIWTARSKRRLSASGPRCHAQSKLSLWLKYKFLMVGILLSFALG